MSFVEWQGISARAIDGRIFTGVPGSPSMIRGIAARCSRVCRLLPGSWEGTGIDRLLCHMPTGQEYQPGFARRCAAATVRSMTMAPLRLRIESERALFYLSIPSGRSGAEIPEWSSMEKRPRRRSRPMLRRAWTLRIPARLQLIEGSSSHGP